MKKAKKRIIKIGLLAGAASFGLYVINKIISATAVVKNLLTSEKKDYYGWRYGNIYYKKKGSGKPILLLHDLDACSSSYEWDKVMEGLSESYTVYAIDLLGCGRSDKPAITYTNYLYVQLITDFAKDIIGEKTDLVACGLSASFAITACNMDADQFGKAILINPEDPAVLSLVPDKKSKAAKVLLELPLVGSLVYNIVYARPNIEYYFTEKWLYNPFHTNSYDCDVYYESAHRQDGKGRYLLSSIKGRYAYFNIAHALKSTDNSIYIIGGATEPHISEIIALYSSLNPSIESVTLSGAKHLPQIDRPDALIEQLALYLD